MTTLRKCSCIGKRPDKAADIPQTKRSHMPFSLKSTPISGSAQSLLCICQKSVLTKGVLVNNTFPSCSGVQGVVSAPYPAHNATDNGGWRSGCGSQVGPLHCLHHRSGTDQGHASCDLIREHAGTLCMRCGCNILGGAPEPRVHVLATGLGRGRVMEWGWKHLDGCRETWLGRQTLRQEPCTLGDGSLGGHPERGA